MTIQKFKEKEILLSKADPEGQGICLAGWVQDLVSMVEASIIGGLILLLGVLLILALIKYCMKQTEWI